MTKKFAISTSMKKKVADYYYRKYHEYQEEVLDGKVRAGYLEKLKIERQIREMEQGVEGFVWSWNKAVEPLIWMSINLAFPLGAEFKGKKMKLQPWQAWDTMVLFGWVSEKDGSYRFLEAFIEVARKNGKSTWVAALLDYAEFANFTGAYCYCGATTLEQSEEIVRRAGLCLQEAGQEGVQINISKNNKEVKWGQGIIRGVASAPKDGKLAKLTAIDEYHQHADSGLADSFSSGNITDEQSLLFKITTAGTNVNGVCKEEHDKCVAILEGKDKVDRKFVSIYAMDVGADISDPDNWRMANPNLDVSVKRDKLAARYQAGQVSVKDLIDFKTKNLNMWIMGTQSWANMPIWLDKCQWNYPDKDRLNRVCYGGLDLASVSDFCAFALDFPICLDMSADVSHFIELKCWVAENRVEELQRQCRIPLREWIAQGYVIATPGDIIDYNYIAEALEEAYSKYEFVLCGCDRYKLIDLTRTMTASPWVEDTLVEFSQGFGKMSPAITNFERDYKKGKISAGGNPVLTWMMDCAISREDANGNIKLDKPKARTGKKIDGLIASIMAHQLALDNTDSVIDDVSLMVMGF